MTRKIQNFPAHYTVHLVRGNPEQRCFYSISDYDFYLQQLQYFLTLFKVRLHAYVLTKKLVQLLMTPSNDTGIYRMMEQLETCYQRRMISRCYTNKPVWTDTRQWSLIQPQTFLLDCSQYIEYLPVALDLCDVAMEHPWSSYNHNVTGKNDSLISEHIEYKKLGSDSNARASRYHRIFDRYHSNRYHSNQYNSNGYNSNQYNSNQYNSNRYSEIRYKQIRLSLKQNLPLGNRTFANEIQQRFGNRFGNQEKGFFRSRFSLPRILSKPVRNKLPDLSTSVEKTNLAEFR